MVFAGSRDVNIMMLGNRHNQETKKGEKGVKGGTGKEMKWKGVGRHTSSQMGKRRDLKSRQGGWVGCGLSGGGDKKSGRES